MTSAPSPFAERVASAGQPLNELQRIVLKLLAPSVAADVRAELLADREARARQDGSSGEEPCPPSSAAWSLTRR